MKSTTNIKKGSRKAWSPINLVNKSIIFGSLMFMGIQAPTLHKKFSLPNHPGGLVPLPVQI
jgi:hypothetical protein